jgi:hypothetical protein
MLKVNHKCPLCEQVSDHHYEGQQEAYRGEVSTDGQRVRVWHTTPLWTCRACGSSWLDMTERIETRREQVS